MIHKVEVFLGPLACACSGLVDLKAMEKHTRAEMIVKELRNLPEAVELAVFRADDEDAYPSFFKKLSVLLRSAGEEDFADSVAFSIRYVTPAIAVDGELRHFGQVPGVEEFLAELGF